MLNAARVKDWIKAPLQACLPSIHGAQRPVGSVALTFDDGPDREVTPALLDLFRARGVKATFFVMIHRAEAQPDLIRRLVQEGHDVALHFDRHDRLPALSRGEAWRRLRAASRSLRALAGPIRYFRPPYGHQTMATYLMARALGLEVVAWSGNTYDWEEQTSAALADRATADLQGGEILLMHDGLELSPGETAPSFDRVEAVGLILDRLAARGLSATSVSRLVDSSGARRRAWFHA